MNDSTTIVRIAARGDGVTEDGRFVAQTAPGDRIRDDGSVLAGPHHATPPCRHFPECGGCQLQHVDDGAYAGFLADRIAASLASHGVAAADILAAHISPPCSRRRASLSAERRGSNVLIGFKAEASHRIVDMRECHILRPELFALVAPLRGLLSELMARKTGAARMTLADQGVDLMLEGVRGHDLESIESLTEFAREQRLARLVLDDGVDRQTQWEPDPVTVTLGGVPVALPPGGFLQATQPGEAALVAAVREAIAGAVAVADLFAGLGTFALALDARLLAVEGSRNAAEALHGAANRAGLRLKVEHRDLYRRPLDASELNRFDAVVLDPPRAGAKTQVAQIARSDVPRVAYVSCNPSTFARDARTLAAGGYCLSWVMPVGQFRWSTQVELVALFER